MAGIRALCTVMLLSANTGCSTVHNSDVPISEHSITSTWKQRNAFVWEKVLIDAAQTNVARQTPEIAVSEGLVSPRYAGESQRPVVTTPTTQRQSLVLSDAPQSLSEVDGLTRKREQQLTLKYAGGDLDAAYELATLLYSQKRNEAADVVLDYAVRMNHQPAIRLRNERPRVGMGASSDMVNQTVIGR